MHNILNRIIKVGNVECLIVSKNNWIKYLEYVAPYRISNKTNKCSIDNGYQHIWCDACNTNIGKWKSSCINNITRENLYKYADIFLYDDKVRNNIQILKRILN